MSPRPRQVMKGSFEQIQSDVAQLMRGELMSAPGAIDSAPVVHGAVSDAAEPVTEDAPPAKERETAETASVATPKQRSEEPAHDEAAASLASAVPQEAANVAPAQLPEPSPTQPEQSGHDPTTGGDLTL